RRSGRRWAAADGDRALAGEDCSRGGSACGEDHRAGSELGSGRRAPGGRHRRRVRLRGRQRAGGPTAPALALGPEAVSQQGGRSGRGCAGGGGERWAAAGELRGARVATDVEWVPGHAGGAGADEREAAAGGGEYGVSQRLLSRSPARVP